MFCKAHAPDANQVQAGLIRALPSKVHAASPSCGKCHLHRDDILTMLDKHRIGVHKCTQLHTLQRKVAGENRLTGWHCHARRATHACMHTAQASTC